MAYQLQRSRTALVEVGLSTNDGMLQERRRLDESSGRDWAPALSPDEGHVAFVSDRNGSQQLWLVSRDDGRAHRLSAHPGARLARPAWSADGRRILYLVRRPGREEVWEHDLRRGSAARLHSGGEAIRAVAYAEDDSDFWMAAFRSGDWKLARCNRRSGSGCTVRDVGIDALSVDRHARGQVRLTLPDAPGRAVVLEEPSLTEVGKVSLSPNSGWGANGGNLVLLQRKADGTHVLITREDGAGGQGDEPGGWMASGRLALSPALNSRLQPSGDLGFVILQAIMESRTDIAVSQLEPPGRSAWQVHDRVTSLPPPDRDSGYTD